MDFVNLSIENNIATVTIARGKVNAINEPVVEELDQCFRQLESDDKVKAVILTGQGKFFSFGFDIPEFYDFSKQDFTRYLRKFTGFYSYLFSFPKPVIAAINGHAVAGGCMLVTMCDYRIMVEGKSRLSLNEITFGSTVFAGSVEILKYCVGARNAELILETGKMFSPEEAKELGLVDEVVSETELAGRAAELAAEYAARESSAFVDIKGLLRRPVVESYITREPESIDRFVEIWYSPSVRANLKKIEIRS